MTEERWVRNLARAARGFNEPPPTPRERMWGSIDRARSRARRPRSAGSTTPWWTRRQILWPAAVVAALVVGLTVGRVTGPTGEAPPATPRIADASRTPAGRPTPEAYRLAARPVLARSEALLLQVSAGTGRQDGDASTYAERAGALLSQTRLLLGSPAADDPGLGPLLRDLELSLARIVQLAADPEATTEIDPERKALEDGLDRKAILPRIRDQLATGPVAVGS